MGIKTAVLVSHVPDVLAVQTGVQSQASVSGKPFGELVRDRLNDIIFISVIIIAAILGYVFFDVFYQALLAKIDYLNLIDQNMYLAVAGFLVLGLVLERLSRRLSDMSRHGFGLGVLLALYLYLGRFIEYGGFGDPDLDPMLPYLQAIIGLIALIAAVSIGYNILKRFTTKTPARLQTAQATPPAMPAQATQPAPGTHVEKIIHEKETIKEIVKIPCSYCGTLMEITETRCPSCGAPLKK
jgi:hypothetical protein